MVSPKFAAFIAACRSPPGCTTNVLAFVAPQQTPNRKTIPTDKTSWESLESLERKEARQRHWPHQGDTICSPHSGNRTISQRRLRETPDFGTHIAARCYFCR